VFAAQSVRFPLPKREEVNRPGYQCLRPESATLFIRFMSVRFLALPALPVSAAGAGDESIG